MTTRLSISFVGMTDTGLDSDPRPEENTQIANRIQINEVHAKELFSQQHKRKITPFHLPKSSSNQSLSLDPSILSTSLSNCAHCSCLASSTNDSLVGDL